MRAQDDTVRIGPCNGQDAPEPWLVWVDARGEYRIVAYDGAGRSWHYLLEQRQGSAPPGQEWWVPVDPHNAQDVQRIPRHLRAMIAGQTRSP